MNIPSEIKGFSAPDFPTIIGLPICPLMTELCEAIIERYALVNKSPWYNVEGFIIKPGRAITHDHINHSNSGSISSVDDEIARISSEYINQYTMQSGQEAQRWSFNTLLAKAQKLLGLSDEEIIPSMNYRNDDMGYCMWLWAVQRLTMVSLLTHLPLDDVNTMHYKWIYMDGYYGWDDHITKEEHYNKAVQNAEEVVYDSHWSSSIDGLDAVWFSYSQDAHHRSASVRETKKIYLLPNNDYTALLNGQFVLYANIESKYFDDFDTNLVPGYNYLPVTMDDDGCFWDKTFPRPPKDFNNDIYHCWISKAGYLIGNYYNHFTYGMTWDESQDNQEN